MKEIYKLSPPMQKSSRTTALFIIISLFVCAILLKLSTYLPAAWIFEILIIILCAAWINKILKQGVFTLTYILYEDSLKFYTRYGFIEKTLNLYDTVGLEIDSSITQATLHEIKRFIENAQKQEKQNDKN